MAYLIREFDVWYSSSSQVPIGVFTDKEKAVKALKENYFSRGLILEGIDRWEYQNQFEIHKPLWAKCGCCGEEIACKGKILKHCPECGEEINTRDIETEHIGGLDITEFDLDVIEEI